MSRKTSDNLERAHKDWTGKFVQAQKEAGQAPDAEKAQRRAAEHVRRVERDIERRR